MFYCFICCSCIIIHDDRGKGGCDRCILLYLCLLLVTLLCDWYMPTVGAMCIVWRRVELFLEEYIINIYIGWRAGKCQILKLTWTKTQIWYCREYLQREGERERGREREIKREWGRETEGGVERKSVCVLCVQIGIYCRCKGDISTPCIVVLSFITAHTHMYFYCSQIISHKRGNLHTNCPT